MKRLIQAIKDFFQPKLLVDKYIVFNNLPDFISLINKDNSFDRHNVYFYTGKSVDLQNHLSTTGGWSIKNCDLEFIAVDHYDNNTNCLKLTENYFFPDIAKSFKEFDVHNAKTIYYKQEELLNKINNVVVTNYDIYFCSK